MPVVLLTGFEPFGGDAFNPSIAIAERLDGAVIRDPVSIARAVIRAERLPCVFGAALEALDRALRRHRPTLAIALGLAASRADISIERIAINVDDARIPDNAGQQPFDTRIVAHGPAAYWSTLPIKAMVAAIRAAGLPASVSQSAGTFVCNHVFYGLAHRVAARRRRTRAAPLRGGFIHVPMPSDGPGAVASGAGLTLEQMTDAIRIAIEVAVLRDGDERGHAFGAID
ncbi:MAG: pyroglutamyl-peptidase I [Lautropia sp.]